MESRILSQLEQASAALGIQQPFDGRQDLPRNPGGKKWKKRVVDDLKGLVWHQELGKGSVEAVARYHTGAQSHLHPGGVESIAYSFAIRKNGQIILCNPLDRATWSQGYKGRPGDENAEFLSVMFEGLFQGMGVTDLSAGQPNDRQMLSGLILWQVCRRLWKWKEGDLYGHFLFGKASCPGATLQTVVEAVRSHARPRRKLATARQRQQALKDLGFYEGRVDGQWGPASKGALTRFQQENGLSADGVWGPVTEARVAAVLEEME